VGLDGGFIHAKDQKSRSEGWFEVIAGKSMPEEGAAKCFAYVQTYDTKPKRRLFELMKSQGLQANQQVTFLSDGADDVRERVWSSGRFTTQVRCPACARMVNLEKIKGKCQCGEGIARAATILVGFSLVTACCG
jgi:hypothetical protein